jgi:hypothetical protein
MKSRLVNPDRSKALNPGDKEFIAAEPIIKSLTFNHHRFTDKVKPNDPRRHLIIPCFSEFGSEVVASMYCIPRLTRLFPDHYKTVVGWHGREHLYRHLVDEFWELDEDHMWLREYSRAFHHASENLKKFETNLQGTGVIVTPQTMGRFALTTQCNQCWKYWRDVDRSVLCRFCKSNNLRHSFYSDPKASQVEAVLPDPPKKEKVEFAKSLVGRNPVGIFARARKCYGRNLPSEFYAKLIGRLESLGYDPIWLGEKSTTLSCPMDHIVDFSRMRESRDLETTLAIVSLCRFTVQFWTASTRLAAMVKTPYLLFESPDQLWGGGEEGYRLDLITTGYRKLAVSHYLNVLNDQEGGLDLVSRCVQEMERGDYRDVIAMVDNERIVKLQRQKYLNRQVSKIDILV